MSEQRQIIRTARLDVRPLAMDDLHDVHALWSDPDVIFWGASSDVTMSEQMLTRLMARTIPGLSPSGWFAIIRRSDGVFVGDVVLQPAPWHATTPRSAGTSPGHTRGVATRPKRREVC
jgi:RimJ/RimL family protein N-acetyltransferase